MGLYLTLWIDLNERFEEETPNIDKLKKYLQDQGEFLEFHCYLTDNNEIIHNGKIILNIDYMLKYIKHPKNDTECYTIFITDIILPINKVFLDDENRIFYYIEDGPSHVYYYVKDPVQIDGAQLINGHFSFEII